MDTQPSTNWAQRRATMLMEDNALLLSHAASQISWLVMTKSAQLQSTSFLMTSELSDGCQSQRLSIQLQLHAFKKQ